MAKKFKLVWYDMEEEKLTEYIYAVDQKDAVNKAYEKYGGRNTPGPMLLVEEVN